jgi:hypothetical protein
LKRSINILNKIGSLIPGYNGYEVRSDKRNSDKIFRDHNSFLISKSETSIVEFQKALLADNKIQLIKDWELVRKKLNTLTSILKHSNYGESSFFAMNQIKELELDQIMEFDERIFDRVQLIFKTCHVDLDESLSGILIMNCIKEIEGVLIERSTYISKFK